MQFAKFKKVQQKKGGRLFAIGDVHGCLNALQKLLMEIAFDETKDQIIFVGDLADRGTQNVESIEFVLDKPHFHLVAGNHEDLLVEAVTKGKTIHPEMMEFWMSEDGTWTESVDESILLELSEKLRTQGHYIVEATTESGTKYGLTHAGHDDEQWFKHSNHYEYLYFRKLMWSRQKAESLPNSLKPVIGVDFTVHGHTIFQEPTISGNAIFIDTGCVFGGKLTALDLGRFAETRSLLESTTYSTQ